MQISRNIGNGPKCNNYVVVGIRGIVCVQKSPHHFLQTLHSLRIFQIVFRDSSLYSKQLHLFCLLRLISASADRNGYISNFTLSTLCAFSILVQFSKIRSCKPGCEPASPGAHFQCSAARIWRDLSAGLVNAQPDIFAVMNFCVVVLSLFFSDSLTWSADSWYSVQWHIK